MATAPSQIQPQDVNEETTITHGCGEPNEIQGGLTLWEEKVKQLEDQFKEVVSPQMKVAIITSAMPNKVQGHILSQTNTTE